MALMLAQAQRAGTRQHCVRQQWPSDQGDAAEMRHLGVHAGLYFPFLRYYTAEI